MLKMAPSFMSANLLNIQGELYALDPYADYYHVDIIDWHYVKNMCLTPQIIKAMSSATEVPIEAHLYVDTIDENLVDLCLESGAKIITMPSDVIGRSVNRLANQVHHGNARFGVFLNPYQEIQTVIPYIHELDSLLIMSVDPGFGGQDFLPQTFDRVREAYALRSEHGADFQIAIDGNCDDDKFAKLAAAGADAVCLGRGVFSRHPDTAIAGRLTKEALAAADESVRSASYLDDRGV